MLWRATNALDTERSMMGHLFEKKMRRTLPPVRYMRFALSLVNLQRMFFESPRCVVAKAKMEMKYVMCVEIMGKGTLPAKNGVFLLIS